MRRSPGGDCAIMFDVTRGDVEVPAWLCIRAFSNGPPAANRHRYRIVHRAFACMVISLLSLKRQYIRAKNASTVQHLWICTITFQLKVPRYGLNLYDVAWGAFSMGFPFSSTGFWFDWQDIAPRMCFRYRDSWIGLLKWFRYIASCVCVSFYGYRTRSTLCYYAMRSQGFAFRRSGTVPSHRWYWQHVWTREIRHFIAQLFEMQTTIMWSRCALLGKEIRCLLFRRSSLASDSMLCRQSYLAVTSVIIGTCTCFIYRCMSLMVTCRIVEVH